MDRLIRTLRSRECKKNNTKTKQKKSAQKFNSLSTKRFSDNRSLVMEKKKSHNSFINERAGRLAITVSRPTPSTAEATIVIITKRVAPGNTTTRKSFRDVVYTKQKIVPSGILTITFLLKI